MLRFGVVVMMSLVWLYSLTEAGRAPGAGHPLPGLLASQTSSGARGPGDASVDEIAGGCGGKGPFPKAPAPWWEGSDVLYGKKSVQPLSRCLPEAGQGQTGHPGLSTLTD